MTITEEDIFELDESYIGEEVYRGDTREQVIINAKLNYSYILRSINHGSEYRYHTGANWKYAYPVNGPHEKDKKQKTTMFIGNSMPKTAVHCKTQTEYWDLMVYLEKLGGKWNFKNLPTSKNHWTYYNEETCIYVENITDLMYSPKDWYIKNGYTVITLQDYLKTNDSTEVKKDGTTFMSTIKNFIKTSLLSAEEKLLRKHGFKTECGEYTLEAKDFAINELCKANESKMVAIATEMDAEEAKK